MVIMVISETVLYSLFESYFPLLDLVAFRLSNDLFVFHANQC
jgi:hypothetical protein